MSPPVSHRQLAAAAGVCQSTVSLSLRNHPKISPRVRAHVQHIAAQLGYRPNPVVAALMGHIRAAHAPTYQSTLGFVFTQKRSDAHLCDNTVQHYFRGALSRAKELGYALEPFWLGAPEMTEARLAQILVNRGIHGLVLAPIAFNAPERFRGGQIALPWGKFSAAAIGRTLLAPDLDRACHDNFSAMLLLLSELVRRGYRRIGFAINHKDDGRVNHLWLAGYLTFMHEHSASGGVPPLVAHDWRAEIFIAWFECHRPDAIVTMTYDALLWLRARGFDAPGDVGVATVSWLPYKKDYSGNYHNYELIGAEAVNIVVSRLQRNELGPPANPHAVLVKGSWVEGRSLRPCPDALRITDTAWAAHRVVANPIAACESTATTD